jgi:hypothetical protein
MHVSRSNALLALLVAAGACARADEPEPSTDALAHAPSAAAAAITQANQAKPLIHVWKSPT